MSETVPIGPDERDQVLREVALSLVDAAPSDWQEISLEFTSTVAVDGATLQVTRTSGEVAYPSVPGKAVDDLHDLRAAMREADKGSWFTARMKVLRPGKYVIDFDYDNEPPFDPPLQPSAYWVDFDYFPRSPEHTPDWLRTMLDQEKNSASNG
ncbi:hypothetical protein AB0H12_31365 [Actinosynnema sp. NPDC023794]